VLRLKLDEIQSRAFVCSPKFISYGFSATRNAHSTIKIPGASQATAGTHGEHVSHQLRGKWLGKIHEREKNDIEPC